MEILRLELTGHSIVEPPGHTKFELSGHSKIEHAETE